MSSSSTCQKGDVSSEESSSVKISDEDHRQVLLSPRRTTVEATDNENTVDEDMMDLNNILHDCIKVKSFDKHQVAQN